jgi:AcrR family transcriptional regulator
LLLNRVIDMAVEQRHIVSVLQFDPVIIRFLAEHEPFKQFIARLYGALVGDVAGTESRVQTAMLSGAIGSAVMHPLVADLDDDTLRSQLLHLTRGLIDLRQRLPADTVDIEIPSVSHLVMATRLRRVEQVERNREIVLAAARRVFLRRGYAGASLEAIAEEAGFSKGVVYSQFGSKPDLFFALLERRIEEWAAQNERIAAQFAGAEGVQELLRAVVQEASVDAGWQYLLTEFRALAMRDANLNQRYAAAHARTVAQLAAVLVRLHERTGLQPAVSVRSMAEFILAQAAGIALERAANPDAIPARDVARILSRTLGLHDSPSPESAGLA